MTNIEQIIDSMLSDASEEQNILKYVYNENTKFREGVTPVYYSGPYWDKNEIISAIRALLLGKWLSSGENVHKFEIEFSKKFNLGNSVMVNSGSSANLVMLASLKKVFSWNDGDEIIVSPVGFATTIAPIVQNNLKPVFVDIEWESLNFKVEDIENLITKKTKAIFISPVLGNPPDFDHLIHIKEKYGIELVLDNCDSLGSKWKNEYLTEYSIASSCSFYPAHHITTGEGGMISSKNEEIISTARSYAWWGRDCYCVGSANLLQNGTCGNRFNKWLDSHDGIIDHKYVFTNMGYNLKPLDMQGAIGLIQLNKFDEIHDKRINSNKEIIKSLNKHLSGFYTSKVLSNSEVSWFGTPIISKSDNLKKNELVNYLEKNKIQTRPYFAGNILLHPAYRDLADIKDYPNANMVLDKVFFIGASPHYDKEILNYIDKIFSQFSKLL